MRWKLIAVACVSFFLMVSCAPTSHFGVTNKAIHAPDQFGETEAAIAKAEQSEGAKYCPEKIARAKELGKKAADVYWACRTDEAMALLAEARKLAREAESCQAPARVTPAPPPRPAPPPPPPGRQPISFHSVYFDFDKSNLKPEGRAALDSAAKVMQDNPDVVLELQGNTDSVGTDAYNKALGDRRAKTVFDYLNTKGVSSSRLKTVSFGESKPAASNATEEGRAKNRRTDLLILRYNK